MGSQSGLPPLMQSGVLAASPQHSTAAFVPGVFCEDLEETAGGHPISDPPLKKRGFHESECSAREHHNWQRAVQRLCSDDRHNYRCGGHRCLK